MSFCILDVPLKTFKHPCGLCGHMQQIPRAEWYHFVHFHEQVLQMALHLRLCRCPVREWCCHRHCQCRHVGHHFFDAYSKPKTPSAMQPCLYMPHLLLRYPTFLLKKAPPLPVVIYFGSWPNYPPSHHNYPLIKGQWQTSFSSTRWAPN